MNTPATTITNPLSREHNRTNRSTTTYQWPALSKPRPIIEIVLPVYNEAQSLAVQVETLMNHLTTMSSYRFIVTIADNASIDRTSEVGQMLAAKYTEVGYRHLDLKGRGRALKDTWSSSQADIVAYMDIDLSTDLNHLDDLFKPLVQGEAAIAIGSRLHQYSQVARGPKREVISRVYNWILRRTLKVSFSDAQCGFKAVRTDAARLLLPEITDTEWFFDTEMLVKAQRRGWLIHEVGVTWIDDPDSRVQITRTALDDLKGIGRLRREATMSPIWEAPAYILLAIGALALFAIGLSASGTANDFYAAAIQAGTKSWKAFFFGSFDASNFITVDKPPFALWVMELSTRIFGFSSWSMLLPNALAGVASVVLLGRTVRRWFGPLSGLLAGVTLALTPVAVLMFRFNNPDAILVLLMIGSFYATTRAIETGKTRWLSLVGLLLGTAFITKMLQGLILVPIIAAVYMLAAPGTWAKRLRQLLVAGVSLAVASLWWPVIVMLTPAANRPYIGGSTDNSIWNLIIGYNGIGRISGSAVGSPGTLTSTATTAIGGMQGGGGMGGNNLAFGGSAGILRMFNAAFGIEISWLLPLALIVIGLGLWLRRRQPRTDLMRAGILLWGGWLVIHAVIFSSMEGTIHPYYVIVMAPAVAALVGLGLPMLWRVRTNPKLAWIGPVAILITAIWSWSLLGTITGFVPWLRWIILVGGLISALGWTFVTVSTKLAWKLAALSGVTLTLLAGPAATAFSTASVTHTGSIPTAGPTSSALGGGMGGGQGGMSQGGGFGGSTATGTPPTFQTGSMAGSSATNTTGSISTTGRGAGGGMGSGMSQAADSSLVTYLTAHKGSATWIAATTSTITAAPIELAADGEPVMAIGGFNGSDDAITLTQFEALVSSGRLKYFVMEASGGMGGGGGMGNLTGSSQNAILTWVKTHGTVVNYGSTGSTLYEL